jgi:hypothetical protein
MSGRLFVLNSRRQLVASQLSKPGVAVEKVRTAEIWGIENAYRDGDRGL